MSELESGFYGFSPKDEPRVEIPPRTRLLREAEELVRGVRDEAYGSPAANFTQIAGLWTAQFAQRLGEGEVFTAHDVALAMILVKCARLGYDPTSDDGWRDIAGYAATGYECIEEE